MPSAAYVAPQSNIDQPLHKKPTSACIGVIALILILIVIIPFLIFGTVALNQNHEAVATYKTQLGIWLTRYSDDLTNFDTLIQTSHSSPSIWRQEIHKQLDDIKSIDNNIRAYHPSFSVSEWHTGLVTEVANRYDNFIELYSEGLDNNDASKIQKAESIRKTADEYRLKFQALLK